MRAVGMRVASNKKKAILTPSRSDTVKHTRDIYPVHAWIENQLKFGEGALMWSIKYLCEDIYICNYPVSIVIATFIPVTISCHVPCYLSYWTLVCTLEGWRSDPKQLIPLLPSRWRVGSQLSAEFASDFVWLKCAVGLRPSRVLGSIDIHLAASFLMESKQ